MTVRSWCANMSTLSSLGLRTINTVKTNPSNMSSLQHLRALISVRNASSHHSIGCLLKTGRFNSQASNYSSTTTLPCHSRRSYHYCTASRDYLKKSVFLNQNINSTKTSFASRANLSSNSNTSDSNSGSEVQRPNLSESTPQFERLKELSLFVVKRSPTRHFSQVSFIYKMFKYLKTFFRF